MRRWLAGVTVAGALVVAGGSASALPLVDPVVPLARAVAAGKAAIAWLPSPTLASPAAASEKGPPERIRHRPGGSPNCSPRVAAAQGADKSRSLLGCPP